MSRRTKREIRADQRAEAGYGPQWSEIFTFEQDTKLTLFPGMEFSIPWKGRYIFQRVCVTSAGESWVTAYGGKRGVAEVRSFSTDLMRTKARVHRTDIKRQEIDRTIAKGDQ